MKMSDPVPQFSHLIRGLKDLKLAYIHLVESRIAGNADVEATESLDSFIELWGNQSPVFVAGGYKPDTARKEVERWGDMDVGVVFGRFFISNPDLVFRIREGLELQKYERGTFYKVHREEGYMDYAFSKEWEENLGSLKN
jgi:NADPH2 dehydrogenase